MNFFQVVGLIFIIIAIPLLSFLGGYLMQYNADYLILTFISFILLGLSLSYSFEIE